MAKTTTIGAGQLTERLTIQTSTPLAFSVTSLTRAGTTATVTTATAHGYVNGDYVAHAGADQLEYNVTAQVTVASPSVYTFEVSGAPATPATGTITAVYVSDASGGHLAVWRTLAPVWGEMRAMSAGEQLQAKAIGSTQSYVGRIYYRPDVTPKMRVSWVPYLWTSAKVLEIHGVQPDPDDQRRILTLALGEAI